MLNDPTIIEVSDRDAAHPLVAPSRLAALTEAMEELFRAALAGDFDASAHMNFCAAPRRGSIIFTFAPTIEVVVGDGKAAAGIAKTMLEAGADLAQIGGLLWLAIFGGSGLYQLRQEQKLQAHRVPGETASIKLHNAVLAKHGDGSIISGHVGKVHRAAEALGASKVTVQIADGDVVILFSAEHRRRRGLIARNGKPRVAANITKITRLRAEAIEVQLEDQIFPAFVASAPVGAGTVSIVIVWRSARELPLPGTTVTVEGVTPIASQLLTPKSNVTKPFEDANAIYLVDKSAIFA